MNQPINVLLIEDSEDDALLVLRSLRQGGLQITSQRVETAEALQEALNNSLWDVIICDYNLPHFDAPRALEIVQEHQIDIPFIVVSGTIGEASAVELMKQGANDYLMKGRLTRLPEAIRREVRESQIRKERKQSAIELAQTKERLQLALEGSAIGIWDWTVPTGGLTINDRWAEMLGYTVEELAPISVKTWELLVHPDDQQETTKLLQKHFRNEVPIYESELRLHHKSRGWFWVLCKGKVTAWDDQGNPLRVTGTHLDINDRKQAELRLSLQSAILERISKAEPLSEILNALVTTIEAFMNNGICALFLCGNDGKLHYEFSPSLPDTYGQMLEGIAIAEGFGACGTAAFRQEMVVVSDITTDPLWQDYQELAIAHNFRSCWSMPVIASDGEALAAFTIYHQDIYQPSAQEIEIINLAVDITKIAIERDQSVLALEQSNRNLEIRVAQRTDALRQSEAKLLEAQQIAHLGSWELDIPTRKITWSAKVFDIFGVYISQGEPTYPEQLLYFHPDDRDRFSTLVDRAIDFAEPYASDFQIIRADGSSGYIFAKAELLGDVSGKVTRLFGIVMDISDRKQAEILLTQQNNQELLLREVTQRIRQSLDLQTIFKTSVEEVRQFLKADRVGIFKFYPESNFDDGEIVAESVVNGYLSAIAIRVHDHTFGENYANLYAKGRYYVVDDIYGNGDQKCHVDILARFQVRANIVMPLLSGDNLWGLLCIHQCGSTRHWLQTEIDFCEKISNQLAIAIQQASLFDQLQKELIERQQTEAKVIETNQQLAVSNQELVRATRLKDEFLANMSHELRTPLNSILGMTEAMLDEIFGSINDRQRKSLQTVDRSASHLLELINDILDVAKIESGQIELDCTSISVSHLCQSSLAFIKQQALKKRIQLEISQLPTNLPDLLADERRIRQVLINLLNNAVKFTPEGGRITLAVSQITSTNPETQQFLRIAIIDTGIGISAENIPKLFQPFIQIDSALNRQYSGTGLGLSLVKRPVELHGGNVELTSELGVGSCFAIELPASPMRHIQEVVTISSDPEPVDHPIKEAPLVLLAEDNEANIVTISSYLEAKGYRIILAKDGLEAIATAKLHQPDLILMDIQMPKMDGIEAIKNIRREPQLTKIPIIALTALAMVGDREKCIKAGANDYLAKPIRLRALAQLIQAFLSA
ncbi:MAG: response regulator [Pseudanabaena sp.]